MTKLQYLLYADAEQSLLVVLQALDAAGKDGVVRHLFSGMNPQGTSVYAFKQPSQLELAHDFLWRAHLRTPSKGELVIYNRSHYEDVLVVRVHDLTPESVWSKRYDLITDFEKMLSRSGTRILKFYLHISPEEQLKRFGVWIIAMTGDAQSTLGRLANAVLDTWVREEACPHDLAPTTSTTAALAVGDALAVALLERKGFRREDFARLHPGGSLGRKLLTRVSDVMVAERLPILTPDASMRDAVVMLAERRGTVAVLGADRRVAGVITAFNFPVAVWSWNALIAAVCGDIGIPPEIANALFIISRVPGIAAQAHEELERERPMRQIDPEEHVYDGATERRLPEKRR